MTGKNTNHLEFGAEGERIAANALTQKGWKILGRNTRSGRGELDIIAMDGDELVFVEVRTRSIGRMLPPEQTVGPRKIRRLLRAARTYIDRVSYEGNWRIDVMAITEAGGERRIEHFADVTMGMEGGFMG